MQFLIFIFVLVLPLRSTNGLNPVAVQLLAAQAEKYLAPFIDTSREKLHGQVFGSGRAARSTDVVLFNKSGKSFQLQNTDCETGGWSSSLFPEHEIPAHSSVTYGGESYGFFTGVTECVVKYRSKVPDTWFEVNFSNPYIGPVLACAIGHNVEVKVLLGRGNNNILRVVVDDGEGADASSSKDSSEITSDGNFIRCN